MYEFNFTSEEYIKMKVKVDYTHAKWFLKRIIKKKTYFYNDWYGKPLYKKTDTWILNKKITIENNHKKISFL